MRVRVHEPEVSVIDIKVQQAYCLSGRMFVDFATRFLSFRVSYRRGQNSAERTQLPICLRKLSVRIIRLERI